MDSFNMRLSCEKKQDILQRLSAGQTVSLNPANNGWCRKVALSEDILNELSRTSDSFMSDDWSTMLTKILFKISGAIEAARDWLDPLGSFRETTSEPIIMGNTTSTSSASTKSELRSSIPTVLRSVWSMYLSSKKTSIRRHEMRNWIYCQSPTIPLHFTKPSWWFFVVDRCIDAMGNTDEKDAPTVSHGNPKIRKRKIGIPFAYRIELRNGVLLDVVHGHFSAQKFGSLEMDMVFLVVMALIVGFTAHFTYKLHRLRQLHPAVYLWSISVLSRFLAQFLRLAATVRLASTGLQSWTFNIVAQLLYSTSLSTLFATLLLLTSGFNVLHHTFSRTVGALLFVLLMVYALTSAGCHVAMELLQFRGDILSRYHSPASYVFVALQILAWFGFIVNTGYTVFNWSEKRLFFLRLAAVYTPWFWNIPFWVCITTELSHKQFTETTIRIWDELISFAVYVLLLLLLKPRSGNSIFPFQSQPSGGISRETIIEPEVIQPPTPPYRAPPSPRLAVKSMGLPKLHLKETAVSAKTSKPASPTRPPPGRLPAIGGKPGDMPGPGFQLTRNLAALSVDTPWQKRPHTTPDRGMATPQRPRLRRELDVVSTN